MVISRELLSLLPKTLFLCVVLNNFSYLNLFCSFRLYVSYFATSVLGFFYAFVLDKILRRLCNIIYPNVISQFQSLSHLINGASMYWWAFLLATSNLVYFGVVLNFQLDLINLLLKMLDVTISSIVIVTSLELLASSFLTKTES